MTNSESQLLAALAWMAEQYLKAGDELDSLSMSAGERALKALADHGLVQLSHGGRIGTWTRDGVDFLNAT